MERLLIALLVNGKVLMEGWPGLAKTQAIRTLAQQIESEFRRAQFTPDLLPSDITSAEVSYGEGGSNRFKFQPGPLFGNGLLADDINWAPTKVQVAPLADTEHSPLIDDRGSANQLAAGVDDMYAG